MIPFGPIIVSIVIGALGPGMCDTDVFHVPGVELPYTRDEHPAVIGVALFRGSENEPHTSAHWWRQLPEGVQMGQAHATARDEVTLVFCNVATEPSRDGALYAIIAGLSPDHTGVPEPEELPLEPEVPGAPLLDPVFSVNDCLEKFPIVQQRRGQLTRGTVRHIFRTAQAESVQAYQLERRKLCWPQGYGPLLVR